MKTLGNLTTQLQEPRIAECSVHGEFESKNYLGSIWSTCPGCAADKKAEEEKAAAEKEKINAQLRWIATVGAACIPERFQDRTLKNFIAETPAQQNALQFAVNYANTFDEAIKTGRSAVFAGKPGTGKTHLAAGIALRLMHRDKRTVFFTTVRKAIGRVKATWNRDSSETEQEAIKALTTPDLLILDEVGVQFGTDTEKLIMFDIINERYETRRPTILLSNLAIDDIKTYLGERIADRLREDGGDFIIFDWESHRGKSA